MNRRWAAAAATSALLSSAPAWAQTRLSEVDPPDERLDSPGARSASPPFERGLDWLLGWNMSVGTFDTFDFASNYSFRGGALEARYRLRPDLAVGVSAAWHVLDEREVDVTATRGRITVTGTQIRTLNFVPLLARATYGLPDLLGEGTEVWGTLGLGAYYIEKQLEVGLFSERDTSWHFGLAPELGASVRVQEDVAVFVSTAWNFVFESGPTSDQSYLNFNVGFSFY